VPYLVESLGLVQINAYERHASQNSRASMQESAARPRTVEEGIRQIVALFAQVNDVRRETIAAARSFWTHCGGSTATRA